MSSCLSYSYLLREPLAISTMTLISSGARSPSGRLRRFWRVASVTPPVFPRVAPRPGSSGDGRRRLVQAHQAPAAVLVPETRQRRGDEADLQRFGALLAEEHAQQRVQRTGVRRDERGGAGRRLGDHALQRAAHALGELLERFAALRRVGLRGGV